MALPCCHAKVAKLHVLYTVLPWQQGTEQGTYC